MIDASKPVQPTGGSATLTEALIESSKELRQELMLPWTHYIPQVPTYKQLAFLLLPHREAFYGGAAGGGKSSALLMGALQYVDVPSYSALILRKSFSELSLEEALIPRSKEWLINTDAAWNGSQHSWKFPSGAVLQFGYLESDSDKYRYQSAAFQYIAFDELTQHFEDDYYYMFSRLRRLKGFPVPLRMRSASNPGAQGHRWVRQHFKIERVGDVYRGTDSSRPHIPALIGDNPHLDQSEYIESLKEIHDPVVRQQLLAGDWGITTEGRIKRHWLQYFTTLGDRIVLNPGSSNAKSHHKNTCRVFQTVDPAASIREGPADALIWRRSPSWTVISTWLVTPDGDLLWWNVERFQVEVPDVINRIKAEFNRSMTEDDFQPDYIGIEASGLGIGVFQAVKRLGIPVKDLQPRSVDKLVRATDVLNRMESGKFFLKKDAPWLNTCLDELLTWTGHPSEQTDQIDTAAYAGMEVSQIAAAVTVITQENLPVAY